MNSNEVKKISTAIFKTSDDEERYNKYVKDLYLNNRNDDEIKEIISNYDYIDWLINYTKNKKYFLDIDLITMKKISDYDKDNIKKLNIFFEGINYYAEINDISPLVYSNCEFYKLRLDDFGFEIGIIIGEKIISFCRRVSIDNKKTFININDIIYNQKEKVFVKK